MIKGLVLSGLIALIILSGCTANKFLAKDEKYYTGAKVKIIPRKSFEDAQSINYGLNNLLGPSPNTRILGSRPNVWFYQIAGEPEKESGFRYWMKNKLGRKPVLMEDINTQRISQQIQATLHNKGFFGASVVHEIHSQKYSANVIYVAKISPPYRYNSIEYAIEDSTLSSTFHEIKSESLIKTGDRYDLDLLIKERVRMEKAMKDRGYYYFDDEYLLFKIDSTIGNRKVNMVLKLKPAIPKPAVQIYQLDKINLIANSSTVSQNIEPTDTTIIENINYIHSTNEYRPEILTDQVAFRSGQSYQKEDELVTLNRLIQLDVFKFVNVNYNESDSSNTIDANVFLYPNLKKSISFGLQAVTKTNNFIGPNLNITFKNRNLFRGAESYNLTLEAGYEVQIGSRKGNQPLNSYTISLGNELTIPRVISPFNIRNRLKQYVPQTSIRFGLSTLKRVNFFSLNSIDASYGFKWRDSKIKRHQFRPFDINYTQLGKISAAFDSVLNANSGIRSSLEEQFILGSSYSYFYHSQNDESNLRRGNIYFNANLNLSGNIMYLLQSSLRAESTTQDSYKLLGLEYSQFVKSDIDIRYNYKFRVKKRIVTRLIMGIGYAFGNSGTLPYSRQFASGGSTSIRAFRSRSVGPGSYQVPDTVRFIDQTADIKLEGNFEYRFPILGILRGALFTDIGNIWTIREDNERPGSKFNKNNFLSELAVGSGFGFRFDVEYFVLRLDIAIPLRVPYRTKGDRWVIGDINFLDSDWRNENLLFNLGIGYPF